MTVAKLYFDMDGVLSDFDRGVKELAHFNRIYPPYADAEEELRMWAAIRQVEHFYARLHPMPGGLELFRAAWSRYGDRCEILTGIPRPRRGVPEAREDKITWTRHFLSPDVKINLVYKEEKKNFCRGSGDILVDDLDRTIIAWNKFGGTGILVKNAVDAMGKLKEIGVL